MTKIVIDPITRIEGHLRITCTVEGGKVTDAWNTATLFRGFEIFMKNRDPLSIWQFAQRICGVCPTPHAISSAQAVERALGLERVEDNVRLVRNMSEAAQIGYDHILWFYALNAFDYVNVPNALKARATLPTTRRVQERIKAIVESGQLGPFANMYWDHPGYKLPADLDLELVTHYLQSIDAQQKANEASTILGGRFPMSNHLVPGGLVQPVSIEQVLFYKSRMEEVKTFVDTVMLPDLLALAPYYLDLAKSGAGVKNFLSWGTLDGASQDPYDRLFPRGAIFNGELKAQPASANEVRQFTKYAYYADGVGSGKPPLEVGQEPIEFTTLPELKGEKLPDGKYDWTKSARYGKENYPMEVGPLAELLVGYAAGRKDIVQLVDDTLRAVGQPGKIEVLISSLGRIVARVLKAKLNADNANRWADDLLANIGRGKTSVYTRLDTSREGAGAGPWDAPRGALCHYAEIRGGRVSRYAAVPPSQWNLSPRDDAGVRGPTEAALIGTPVADPRKPLEILRLVHTFDP